MKHLRKILDDERPVEALWVGAPDEFGPVAMVGVDGVTKIEAYQDFGDGAMTPWFGVWKGDVLVDRYNAGKLLLIRYQVNEVAP